jgi:hypothetical protein
MAQRISARAWKAAGELLKQLPKSPGGRPAKGENLGGAAEVSQTRDTVAKARPTGWAGQKEQVLR